MIPTRSEIQETLKVLGWGDGSAVHFYDESMREITSSVHKVLGLVDPNATETWNQLVIKAGAKGGGLSKILSCWLKGWQGK